MLAVDRRADTFLYQQVIDLINDNINSGALRPGDRLPSLRRLSTQLRVSIPTVKQAYLELERHGRVQARPQSGYYVRAIRENELVRAGRNGKTRFEPKRVRCRSLIEQVYDGIHQPGVVPLGIANPSMAKPVGKGLHRTMKRVMARAEERSLGYAPLNGEPTLKRQLAYRHLDLGGSLEPDELIITNGGQEALSLALMAVASRGDVIAVESPSYPGILELIENLGMLALEIETCAKDGLMLDALESALDRHTVKACMFASALNNPLGSCTSDAHREKLVDMLEARGVALIEDDVYGELLFSGIRPKPAQVFSRKGLVLTCGSFSKTAAPGYRIGWLVAGKYREKAARLKRTISCSSGLLQQLTLSSYLASGDYDRHLKTLRPVLKRNAEMMSCMVSQHFPGNTRASRPAGGGVLWLELPEPVDSRVLFERALADGISISPGEIYSPGARYRNFIRLSYGHPWSQVLEQAVVRLGAITHELAGSSDPTAVRTATAAG